MPNVIITISRQLGSGGSFIGKELARTLGYAYFDREILAMATKKLGREEASLEGREERLSAFIENLIRPFILGSPETAYTPPPLLPVYDSEIFEAEEAVIRDVAGRHNAVIVGRGAFHILREEPGLVNVFLHAPRKFRTGRVMELYEIKNMEEARSLIEDSDRNRGKFINAKTGANWTDARNYDLCIETEKTGFEAARQMITLLTQEVKAKKLGRS